MLRDQDGDHHLGCFITGDIVGEMALVTREARSADVIADSPVRALLVSIDPFDRLAQHRLELGVLLTELVADRLGQGAHDGFGGKKVEAFRILQEASLLRSLNHENIASLKRLFPAYHTYFLVMELCEGMDLEHLVRWRGPLAEPQVRPILGQLARALEYVHARGLAHRDLKPANVMITRDGRIKFTDFGLAMPVVALENAQTTTPNLIVMGTPAFMAPEQLSGGPVDSRTDVYALGCLAYEMLTGRHLYNATNFFDLVREKLTTRLPPAAEIGSGVSADHYEFLRRAPHENPNERPSSVAQLLEWAAPCDPLPQSTDGAAEGTEAGRSDTGTLSDDPRTPRP